VTGDAPGLYGGTRNDSACDKAALVAFLQADAAKAGAWAQSLGITPGEIPGFVAGLTPAVLRVDTLVTNHGYRDGTATAMPAVLQSGIAVLVDRKGVPVVKCNCGNPLTPPAGDLDPAESDFEGPEWPGFNGEKVTIIGTPGQEVKKLTLVDSELGMAFERPVGSGGDRDGPPEPIPPSARPEPVSTTGQTPAGPTGHGTTTGPGGPSTDPTGPTGPADPESPGDAPGTGGPESTDPGVTGGPATPAEQEAPDTTGAESPSGPDTDAGDTPPSEPEGLPAPPTRIEEEQGSAEPPSQDPGPQPEPPSQDPGPEPQEPASSDPGPSSG
jgi:hypothetical protein